MTAVFAWILIASGLGHFLQFIVRVVDKTALEELRKAKRGPELENAELTRRLSEYRVEQMNRPQREDFDQLHVIRGGRRG